MIALVDLSDESSNELADEGATVLRDLRIEELREDLKDVVNAGPVALRVDPGEEIRRGTGEKGTETFTTVDQDLLIVTGQEEMDNDWEGLIQQIGIDWRIQRTKDSGQQVEHREGKARSDAR